MARLIIKCPYLKGGRDAAHLNYLVKYIATRDGVEKVGSGHAHWHTTKKQQDLIAQIVREFPDSRESLEYEDYLAAPTRGNASEFISAALEQNLSKIAGREKYLNYIAGRPRVEKIDTHGLFTAGDAPLVLSEAADEVANHTGNVWTPIISLRREDAERFGYESAFAWKALVSSKAMEIADSLKINPEHFRWYAAFHNESHHPHLHMICYSTDPREGYLTKTGIRKMKSTLMTEIFRQELTPLYAGKTQRRAELKEQAAGAMRELTLRMRSGALRSERIEQLMEHLADRLQYTSGKKQYGYLKAELKNVVDGIVDELARDERVAEAYRLWREAKGLISNFYSDGQPENLPLSQCEEFKPIRNMVVAEAVRLMEGGVTFEEPAKLDAALPEPENDTPSELPMPEDMPPEVDAAPDAEIEESSPEPPPVSDANSSWRGRSGGRASRRSSRPDWWTADYKRARQFLFGDEDAGIGRGFDDARALFLGEAEKGNPLAMCDLGRMAADGLGCDADAGEAHRWYEKALAGFLAAEEENPWKYTEYRIGKLYAAGMGTEQDYGKAAEWLALSAGAGYKYAQYSLGGLYRQGKGVEQSHETAFALYTESAAQDFPYASFELGKMLRDGIAPSRCGGCTRDGAESEAHFADAFHGFRTLERKGHDDKLQYRLGWMLLNGVGTEKDIVRARSYFEKSAAVGNAFSCYQLAKLILSEESPAPEDAQKALHWLRQSVDAKNSSAQYFLAKLCLEGKHVPRDAAEAARLFTLAAEQGSEFAAYRLGKLYLGGEGVLKDVELALRWLGFAAEKKNQYAEYALGVLYLKGEDVPKDAAKAIAFFKRAAEQGNQFAQYRLGKLYLTGGDAPKDVETALLYLTAAAEQGNQYAQYILGKIYLMGKEAPRDKEAAVKWFSLSAAQGNLYAQFFLDHIDEFKDPSVLLAATRLLHHMGRVFADNTPPPKSPGQRLDSKLLRRLREKKQAQGHARDDHEQAMSL